MEGGANFIDYVKLHAKSGNGGAGSVHFRREKFIPKGGPDGGDGGKGGSIKIRGNKQLWTLLHLRYKKHIKAENGSNGEGNRRKGADGKDVIIDVPLGTVAKNAETGKIIAEITEDGGQEIILPGGLGGLGNDHFKSSTQQAPQYAQPGRPGMEEWLIFELKLLADVGLVGMPNAGKSTLLSVVSAAKPKIADYAFTTIKPNLGVVSYRDDRSFVMADIPGIIEGASQGKGLGHRFLRHIERNATLLFLIPADEDNLMQTYQMLLAELKKYNPELLDKNRIVAISKSDLLDDELKQEVLNEWESEYKPHFISSIANEGIEKLKDMIWEACKDNSKSTANFK